MLSLRNLTSFVVAFAGGTMLVAAAAAETPAAAAPAAAAPDYSLKLREGETVKLTGRLELSGDRAVFFPAGSKESLRLLENLALERITRVLVESRSERTWLVVGVVTEYRGANYLLITKAVQQPGPSSDGKPPRP